MKSILAKMGIAGTTSVVLTEALSLDTLWSALITVAVSVLSVLAVEGVNWLRETIIKHTPKNKKEETQDGEEKRN